MEAARSGDASDAIAEWTERVDRRDWIVDIGRRAKTTPLATIHHSPSTTDPHQTLPPQLHPRYICTPHGGQNYWRVFTGVRDRRRRSAEDPARAAGDAAPSHGRGF